MNRLILSSIVITCSFLFSPPTTATEPCEGTIKNIFPLQFERFFKVGLLEGGFGGIDPREITGDELNKTIQCSASNLFKPSSIKLNGLIINDEVIIKSPKKQISLTISDSFFQNTVALKSDEWFKNIYLTGNIFKETFSARNVKILGDFNIAGSDFRGQANFSKAIVKGDFIVSEDETPGPKPSRICGHNEKTTKLHTTFHKEAVFNEIILDKDLCAAGMSGSNGKKVDQLLLGSITARNVNILQSNISHINLYKAKIESTINLGRTRVKSIDLSGGSKARQLFLMGISELELLDLEGITISERLLLSHPNTRTICWSANGMLDLTSSTIKNIEHIRSVTPSPWPKKIAFSNATISRLFIPKKNITKTDTSYRDLRESTMSCHIQQNSEQDVQDLSFYKDILTSLTKPTMEQVKILVKTAGNSENKKLINNISYTGQEIIRLENCEQGNTALCIKATLSKILIGYGVGTYMLRVLFPVLILVSLGTFIAKKSYFNLSKYTPDEPGRPPREIKPTELWVESLIYSLERLIPFIKFGSASIPEAGSNARLYFIFHTIMGWLLGFFIIDGFTGLLLK